MNKEKFFDVLIPCTLLASATSLILAIISGVIWKMFFISKIFLTIVFILIILEMVFIAIRVFIDKEEVR